MKTIITFKSLFEIGEHIDKLVGDFQEITGDCVDTITNVVIKDIQLIWDEPKELNAAELYYSTYQRPASLPYYVYTAEADYNNKHGKFIFNDIEIDYDES